MPLETNKKDMNDALENLQSAVDDLDGIINSDFIDKFNEVLNQYPYIEINIEELEQEKEQLEDTITALEDEIEELKSEL